MNESINDNRKRRGRPATGTEPMWGIRFAADQREAIQEYAKIHQVTKAEAVRRLIQIALDADKE